MVNQSLDVLERISSRRQAILWSFAQCLFKTTLVGWYWWVLLATRTKTMKWNSLVAKPRRPLNLKFARVQRSVKVNQMRGHAWLQAGESGVLATSTVEQESRYRLGVPTCMHCHKEWSLITWQVTHKFTLNDSCFKLDKSVKGLRDCKRSARKKSFPDAVFHVISCGDLFCWKC